MKIIFVNRFFYPDHSATSQILSDLAFSLSERSHNVLVITSRQRYDAPHERLPQQDSIAGVKVYRVWTTRFGRTSVVGRALDYLTFYISASWQLWWLARCCDVVIAKTDPPLFSVLARPITHIRGVKLVNWHQDIFPEVAQALGIGRGWPANVIYGVLRWLRDGSLRRADMNVALGKKMQQKLRERCIKPQRICVIPNWADGHLIVPKGRNSNPLRAKWKLGDQFVVGYSGNLGRAHNYRAFFNAIEFIETKRPRVQSSDSSKCDVTQHADRPTEIAWLFIGGGYGFNLLAADVRLRGFKSVQFHPYQPRELLAESLSAIDVHLVSLNPELEGLIVPSKVYGILAAGRPIIFVGDVNGEIAHLIDRHRCGRNVAMDDSAALARTILELAADPHICDEMGMRARRAFEAEYDKSGAIMRWEKLLLDVVASRKSPIHACGRSGRPGAQ